MSPHRDRQQFIRALTRTIQPSDHHMPKIEIELATLRVLIEATEQWAGQFEADGDGIPPVLEAALEEARKLTYRHGNKETPR